MCYDDNARPPEPPGSAGATQPDLVLTAPTATSSAAFLALPGLTLPTPVLIFPTFAACINSTVWRCAHAEQGIAMRGLLWPDSG
ncbi:MAG: hypothetical protein U0074_10810 [Kouleothrix sp.]